MGGWAGIAGVGGDRADEKTTELRLSVQKAAAKHFKCGRGLAPDTGRSSM